MTESKPTIHVNNYNKAKKNGNKTERAFDAHKDS